MIQEVIFWGATGQAKVLRECLHYSGISLIALFDNNRSLKSPFFDVPLFYGEDGFEKWYLNGHVGNKYGCLVAIGGSNGEVRLKIQNFLKNKGLKPIIAKHPTAFIAEDVKIGEGSQILANSSVCVDVVMGKACIVNTSAIVDHDCLLGDGVHIAPGAHLAGRISVGKFSMIGTGAIVLPRANIGENVIVGAGAVVTKDIPSNCVIYGNPAKIVRDNINEGQI